MTFVAEPGIMLDVLEYNVTYFSQHLHEYRERTIFPREDEPLLYYNHFRTGRNKMEPSSKFFPFFCYQPVYLETYPMFYYFWDHYDFANNDSPGFLDSLRSEEFRRYCLRFYLRDYQNKIDVDAIMRNDIKNSLRAMALFSRSGSNVDCFVDYLCSFNELVDELVPYLTECYKKMKSLHNHVAPKLFDKVDSITARHEETLRRIHDIPESEKLDDQHYTIHLIENFDLLCKRYKDSSSQHYLIFMSENHEKMLMHWGDTSAISLCSFGQDIGSQNKYDIVQELRKGERTASELSRILYISRSTIDRCLKSLQENLVVTVSKKIGTGIYFALNPKYFFAAKVRLARDINGILEDISPKFRAISRYTE